MSAERHVGARVLRAARAQLREATTDALASALGAVEARVLGAATASSRGRSDRQVERMREVLERDRALASAAVPDPPAPAPSPGPESAATVPPPAAAAPVAQAPSNTPVVPECDEPIRTRSMARLLASQGYPERALAIYAYLLAKDATDPTLEAEAAALRETRGDAI
jgi:hypothetical protein